MRNHMFFKKALCVLLSCLLFLLGASAADRASLFLGDSAWEEDSLLPFIEAEGKQLVPVSAFGAFSGITVTLSETLGSLLLEGTDGYLSYNLNFGTCLDEGGSVTDAEIYRYGGELYLAPEPTCEKFGLRFETEYASDGYLAARLTDGSETLSFKELLSMYRESGEEPLPYLYNPTGRTVGGTIMHPILLIPAVANVGNLLPLLDGHPTTFAIAPQDIKKYVSVIPGIYAAGHTVAYYMDAADFDVPQVFLAEMESANEYLFALLGKTVRIYISTEAYKSIPPLDGYFAKSCRMNLVADDLRNDRMVNMTLYQSPLFGIYNFSLTSDRETRLFYDEFFRKFDEADGLCSMTVTESSSVQ